MGYFRAFRSLILSGSDWANSRVKDIPVFHPLDSEGGGAQKNLSVAEIKAHTDRQTYTGCVVGGGVAWLTEVGTCETSVSVLAALRSAAVVASQRALVNI